VRHADGHYRRADGTRTNQLVEYRYTLRPVRELYGDTPAAEFGPLALKAVRQRRVDAGLRGGTVTTASAGSSGCSSGRRRRSWSAAAEPRASPTRRTRYPSDP
jgi:hypothetical protein